MTSSLRPFALAIFLSMLPISATASQRQPTLLAGLEEESIPAQDLASPSPAAAQSPAAETSPNSGEWVAVPAGQPTTAESQAPTGNSSPASQPSAATPAEITPAIDVGSIATTPQISDSSLTPLIDTAPNPARAASLRITEQQRVELEQGHTADAIRELAHAISIDPSNSYAYFYLGRAY